MHVIYRGPAHIRELGAADLKKVGVEGFRLTTFVRGVPTEVPDGVGTALIAEPLFGNFIQAADPNPEALQIVESGNLQQVGEMTDPTGPTLEQAVDEEPIITKEPAPKGKGKA